MFSSKVKFRFLWQSLQRNLHSLNSACWSKFFYTAQISEGHFFILHVTLFEPLHAYFPKQSPHDILHDAVKQIFFPPSYLSLESLIMGMFNKRFEDLVRNQSHDQSPIQITKPCTCEHVVLQSEAFDFPCLHFPMANQGWCCTYSFILSSSFASDLCKTVGQTLRLHLNCQACKYFRAPGPGCICRLHLMFAHMVKPWHTPFRILWFP